MHSPPPLREQYRQALLTRGMSPGTAAGYVSDVRQMVTRTGTHPARMTDSEVCACLASLIEVYHCAPSTFADRTAAYAQHLLPVPYFHLTFTLPSELRRITRSHQKTLLGLMCRAAAGAVQTLGEDRLGGRLGFFTKQGSPSACWPDSVPEHL